MITPKPAIALVAHIITLAAMFLAAPSLARAEAAGDYAIVVSKATHADPAWKAVVDALAAKYRDRQPRVITFDKSVNEALPALREMFPKHTCFVAKPLEATRQFVADVHQLTRKLDDDPYTDTRWGILTGYDADNALRIAHRTEPLIIRKAASGTEIELDAVEQGIWYCELKQHRAVRKDKGGEPKELDGPGDTTKALVDTLNDFHADLFVTSGHATERDWQIGYRYRNGQFRSEAGQLFGLDTQGHRFPVESGNAKVYMPIGNCLMGHIDSKDAMALAWMKSAGVHQMIGYTVLTWYGYGGWGVLDYFVEQPGRYDFSDAFLVNHHALVHRLTTYFPDLADAPIDANGRLQVTKRPTLGDAAQRAGLAAQDGVGLRYDRDVVAFYGDPAWEARLAPNRDRLAWDQTLTEKDGVYTLTITPRMGDDTFKPINVNGAQRGYRPIVELLPHRVKNVEIIAGGDLSPVVADDFVLVPLPREAKVASKYEIVFKATPIR